MKLPIMGQNCHGQIGCKNIVVRYNFVDKTDFKVINMNTDLIEYVPKTLMKKEFWKTIKNVGPVFHGPKTGNTANIKSLFYPHSDKNISIFFETT